MDRKFGLVALMFALLGGCSFHASMHAGSRTGVQSEPSHSRAHATRSPTEQTERSEGRHEQADGQREQALADAPQPAHVPEQAAPAASAPKENAKRDHDRGHGNDADRVDEDNPGKSKGSDRALASADKKHGDHDRGHGNDADGVDEDNPGKSKGRKGK